MINSRWRCRFSRIISCELKFCYLTAHLVFSLTAIFKSIIYSKKLLPNISLNLKISAFFKYCVSLIKTEVLQLKKKKEKIQNKSLIQSYFCNCHFWMIAKNGFFWCGCERRVQLPPLLSEQRSLTLNGSIYVNTAGPIAWVAMKHIATEELVSGVTRGLRCTCAKSLEAILCLFLIESSNLCSPEKFLPCWT